MKIKHEIRFLDSFKFMASSLEGLVGNLVKCGKCKTCKPGDCIRRYIENGKIVQFKGIGCCEKCKNCKLVGKNCCFPVYDKLKETKKELGEKAELLSRKGIYPYDYMNGIEKFEETKLPPKEKFFSKFNDCEVSDEDYNHAQRI